MSTILGIFEKPHFHIKIEWTQTFPRHIAQKYLFVANVSSGAVSRGLGITAFNVVVFYITVCKISLCSGGTLQSFYFEVKVFFFSRQTALLATALARDASYLYNVPFLLFFSWFLLGRLGFTRRR